MRHLLHVRHVAHESTHDSQYRTLFSLFVCLFPKKDVQPVVYTASHLHTVSHLMSLVLLEVGLEGDDAGVIRVC